MQGLNDAIDQLKRGKAADTRGVNAEMIKYSTRRFKQKPTARNHHHTGETQRSKLHTRAENRHHHRSTDPLVQPPCCRNSVASSTSIGNNRAGRQPPADQARFRPGYSATYHPFTFQQLRQRVPPAAMGRSQRLRKKKTTLWNTASCGKL